MTEKEAQAKALRPSRQGGFLRRNFAGVAMCAQVLVDLSLVVVACLLAWAVREHFAPILFRTPLDYYFEVFSLTAAVCLLCFHYFGLYNPIKSLLNVKEFYGVTKSTVAAFLVISILLVFLRPTTIEADGPFSVLVQLHTRIALHVNPSQISRVTLLLAFTFIFVFMMIGRFVSFRWIQACHRRGIGHRNLLIIGAGSTGRSLQRKFLLMPTLGLNLVGFVDEDPDRVGAQVGRSRILGTPADLVSLIEKYRVGEVIIARPEDPPEKMEGLVEHLEAIGVEYSLVPRFYRLFDTGRVQVTNLDATPIITRSRMVVPWSYRLFKRVIDVLISGVVMLLGLPVFGLLALGIKLDSKGPILFWQTRVGRGGAPFRIAKFRTMFVDDCRDEVAPSHDSDPRVTRFGRLLRRYSLDELPNFWNVFMGDMSLVGPRPEMTFIVERYDRRHRERLLVKPGITGLWQISYARQFAIHDNLDYDIYYIENQSILLDIVIMVLTVIAVVRGTGAY
ncbi:MAG: sugar transferase [Planctomycetes bacterium]|nr:sugar transferase [Planctomycetota bacterium]MCB9910659.1 sugar transferase [Planctomycetota bacterium]HPF15216.1 sugar transferase [Planctomycetota bacterium]HRV80823.1 sugar transferase [Planctomycetota bacterium]